MSASGSKNSIAIGFLTVISAAEHGYLGGYLVLNSVGRPLEFHCTAPVKPNRAQEILFGRTLEPFLFGEQIGCALAGKSKLEPKLICTDQASVLSMRPYVGCPVVCVGEESESEGDRQNASGPLYLFELDEEPAAVATDFSSDEQQVRAAWEPCSQSLDLLEPFERIREAVEEAQRGKRNAA